MVMYMYALGEPDYMGQVLTGVLRIGPGVLGEAYGAGPIIILCLEHQYFIIPEPRTVCGRP